MRFRRRLMIEKTRKEKKEKKTKKQMTKTRKIKRENEGLTRIRIS